MKSILNSKTAITIFTIFAFIAVITTSAVITAQEPGGTPTLTPTVSPSPTISPTVTVAIGIPPEITQYAGDWPLANRDYGNTRATTNSTINSSNVNSLGIAWQFEIPGVGTYGGAAGSNPLILGNTVCFQDMKSNVFAMNKQTGQIIWRHDYNADSTIGPNGPAVGWGKIFVLKDLYTMAALDISNGNELWSTRLSDIPTTGADIQPVAYDGLVYVSTVPGAGDVFYKAGGRGVLYALDQQTGQARWQFDTVRSNNLFGHPEVNSGGGSWYPPAIDTQTGRMFWSIANPAPFPGTEQYPNGSSFIGDTLYTDTLIALNHATGQLIWFNQVLPFDIFDHDLQISPILTRARVNDAEQNIVLTAGKMGTVYAMNRDTGALLWATDVGEHNPESKLRRLPPGTTKVIPGVIGGVETVMSYADGVLYVPVIDYATYWTPNSLDFDRFDPIKGEGELVAIEVATGHVLWIQRLDYMALGAATVVNDLVFTADLKGKMYAMRRDNGDIVWTFQAPAGINGFPAVVGDTIMWAAGAGGGQTGVVGTPTFLAMRLGVATSPTATPTPTPSPSPTSSPTPTSSPSASPTLSPVSINLAAQNFAFNMSTITVKAGAEITVNFNNMDGGVPHNFAVYTNQTATTPIFVGQTITGPSSLTYRFTAPSTPGNYFFRCDIHPATMTGTFTVTS